MPQTAANKRQLIDLSFRNAMNLERAADEIDLAQDAETYEMLIEHAATLRTIARLLAASSLHEEIERMVRAAQHAIQLVSDRNYSSI